MDINLRTLKLGVDGVQRANNLFTDINIDDQIEDAGLKTGEALAEKHDSIDPEGVRERLVIALNNDQLAERVDELIAHGEPLADDSEVLAEELERLSGEYVLEEDSTPEVDWYNVAELFLRILEREITEVDKLWGKIVIAYSQRVLTEVSDPEEIAEARNILTGQGFNWLNNSDFSGNIDSPIYAWRRQFKWEHIAQDYAIDRYHEDTENTFTDEVREELFGGGHQLVVGPPGSGKSTVMKLIAADWYADESTGPVLYRESGNTTNPVNPDELFDAVETTTSVGDTLLVVEDAVRSNAIEIFRLLDKVQDRSDLSVLLEVREHEWDRFEERTPSISGGGSTIWHRLESSRHELVNRTRVPYLSPSEVDAMFSTFVEKTNIDATILPDPDVAFKQVSTVKSQMWQTENSKEIEVSHSEENSDPSDNSNSINDPQPVTANSVLETSGDKTIDSVASPMLLLSFYLPTGDNLAQLEKDKISSPLEARVKQVFKEVNQWSDEPIDGKTQSSALTEQFVLTVAILSAADLPVKKEFLYVLGDRRKEYQQIDHLLDRYRGRVHFGEKNGSALYAPHKFWGITYLRIHQNEAVGPRGTFEQCVNSIFSLFSEESIPTELTQSEFTDNKFFQVIEEHNQELADLFVGRIFLLGANRPGLIKLFAESKSSKIQIPDVCSSATIGNIAFYRGKMQWRTGNIDEGIKNIRRMYKISRNNKDNTERRKIEFYKEVGKYAMSQGHYKSAIRLYDLGLSLSKDLKDSSNMAECFNDLGIAARSRSDYETAEKYHQQSLKIRREFNDQYGEGKILHNLGNIARDRGDYETAEMYHQQSLDIFHKTADQLGKAVNLQSLGIIALDRGRDLETAETYHQQSLNIFRKIGDQSGEAKSLQNLGNIAFERGNYETAESYYEQSLSIYQKVKDRHGEASVLQNLGNIAFKCSDYKTAEEYWHQCIDISREIKHPSSEARIIQNLGVLARDRGEYETAKAHCQQSLSIFREIGDRSGEASVLQNLGNITLDRHKLETAKAYYQQSLSIFREIGDRSGEAKAIGGLGNIALRRSNYDTAETHYQQSLNIFQEIEDRSSEASILLNLGIIALKREDYDTAEAHSQQCLNIFREFGDRSGKAKCLGSLGNISRKRENYQTAKQQYESALNILEEIGQVREEIMTLRHLVKVEDNLDNLTSAVNYCNLGINLIENNKTLKLEVEHRWFKMTRTRLSGDVDGVKSLYVDALQRIQSSDGIAARDILAGVWDCRESFGKNSQGYGICLRAGVGLVVLLSHSEDTERDIKSIINEIESHRDVISKPAATLLDILTKNDPEPIVEVVDENNSSLDKQERITYTELSRMLIESSSPSGSSSKIHSKIINYIIKIPDLIYHRLL